MKQKFILLIVGIFIFAFTSFSQTDQGSLMIGGSAGMGGTFQDGDNSFGMNFSPGAGFFVIDNLAVGASLGNTYYKNDDYSSSTFGFTPFGRFYFVEFGKMALFGHAEIGFGVQSTKWNNTKDSGTMFNGMFGPGLALFLNNHVGLEGILGYSFDKYENIDVISDFGVRIGLQIYLN